MIRRGKSKSIVEADVQRASGKREAESSALKLLELLRGCVVANEIFEDRKYVLAVANDALEHGPQLGLADRLFIPLCEDAGRNLNVSPEFFGGVPAKEEAVEKSGFALREIKLLQEFLAGLCNRVGGGCHVRNRSLQIFAFASRLSGAKKEIL
jgi:hypothetical protein